MDMHAIKATCDRINWHYGRGSIRDIQVSACGAMVATVVIPFASAETPRISFPRPGFLRFRGQVRKILD